MHTCDPDTQIAESTNIENTRLAYWMSSNRLVTVSDSCHSLLSTPLSVSVKKAKAQKYSII